MLRAWIAVLALLGCGTAHARPEYALRQRINQCTQCHALPSGAGPRNVYGKLFGSRDHDPAKTSKTDRYYGDFRVQAYFPPKETTRQSNGFFLMVAAPTANVPIHEDEESGSSFRALLTVDFSPLGTGTREAQVLWKTPTGSAGWVPDFVGVGKSYLPFGLMTDEHRTYTRLQSRTSLRDFDAGAFLAWDFSPALHADLALTNGLQSNGQPTSGDLTYAITPNLRWMPETVPIFLGGSFTYHRTVTRAPSPMAASLYGGVSFHRLTKDALKLTLQGETVVARQWNRSEFNERLGSFFFEDPVSDAAFAASIQDRQSIGAYAEALYDLTSKFVLTYKWDRLVFDQSFPGDGYDRHGVGFRWYLNSNLYLQTRWEWAVPMREGAKLSSSRASQDAALAMLRVWL